MFVLTDSDFSWLKRSPRVLSKTGGSSRTKYTPFTCGLVQGALDALGLPCSVTSDETHLPAVSFQVRLFPSSQTWVSPTSNLSKAYFVPQSFTCRIWVWIIWDEHLGVQSSKRRHIGHNLRTNSSRNPSLHFPPSKVNLNTRVMFRGLSLCSRRTHRAQPWKASSSPVQLHRLQSSLSTLSLVEARERLVHRLSSLQESPTTKITRNDGLCKLQMHCLTPL